MEVNNKPYNRTSAEYVSGANDTYERLCLLNKLKLILENKMRRSYMDNQNLPQVSIAEYVSGAKDMETRLYVMQQSKQTLKNKINDLKDQINNDTRTLNDQKDIITTKYEESKKQYDKIQNEYNTYIKERNIYNPILEYIKGLVIATLLLGWIIGLFYRSTGQSFWYGYFVATPITLMFISLFIYKFKEKEDPEAKKATFEANLKNASSELNNLIEKKRIFDKLPSKIEQKKQSLLHLESLLPITTSAIDTTKANLSVYYSAGIIPPDYRNAACVEIIDYVFRNDQADTMREATLLCNQYQWHGELMDALHSIGKVMIGINNSIHNINMTISSMSANISELASGQTALTNESKLTRYAAESTAKSMEYLVCNKVK